MPQILLLSRHAAHGVDLADAWRAAIAAGRGNVADLAMLVTGILHRMS